MPVQLMAGPSRLGRNRGLEPRPDACQRNLAKIDDCRASGPALEHFRLEEVSLSLAWLFAQLAENAAPPPDSPSSSPASMFWANRFYTKKLLQSIQFHFFTVKIMEKTKITWTPWTSICVLLLKSPTISLDLQFGVLTADGVFWARTAFLISSSLAKHPSSPAVLPLSLESPVRYCCCPNEPFVLWNIHFLLTESLIYLLFEYQNPILFN